MGKEQDEALTALANAVSGLAKATDSILARLERIETANKPPEPSNLSPDEQYYQTMEKIRGSTDDVARIGLVEIVENCTSDIGPPDAEGVVHGATFDAELHHTPVMVGGKLVGKLQKSVVKVLANYRYPAGIDRHISQGGLVPDGLDIIVGPMNDHTGYDQWLATTFYMADNRRFVGKALPPHVRPQQPAATGT